MKLIPTAKLAKKVLFSAFGRLPFPYKLNFVVTGRCNCRCRNCFIWTKKTSEMTLDEIREFFRLNGSLSWIDVTGGEIFMREDILEVFEIIIESCPDLVYLHFPTNGTYPERAVEAAKFIKERTKASLVVTISLDGPKALHDRLRGLEGTFDSAVKTFVELKKTGGLAVYFGMTFSEANIGLFEETLDELRPFYPKISIEDFHFNIPHCSPHYYGNEKAAQPEMSKVAAEFARLAALRKHSLSPLALFEKRYAQGVSPYLATGKSPIPCAALSATVFLTNEGDLFPCTIWDEKLGNIRDFGLSLKRFWESPKTVEAYRKASRGQCPNCWTPCETFPALGKSLLRPLPRKS